jgi:cysteine desulfurase / selenocysteine lyase
MIFNHRRNDFPSLSHKYNGHQLIYLDNAATTQKPYAVIKAMNDFYVTSNAPIHRGIYRLAEEATYSYEMVRQQTANFINAVSPSEIVFTHGVTHGINIVAASWAYHMLHEGDEILITQLEHHSNILPWQDLAKKKGILLKWIPLRKDGTLDVTTLPQLLTNRTKLVAFTMHSNVLGDINSLVSHSDYQFLTKSYHSSQQDFISLLIEQSHKKGARVLLDAAQAAPHEKIDVQQLTCDFLVFSAHKMLGPTGCGILYIKQELHPHIKPASLGGGMVYNVTQQEYSSRNMPSLLEAGTPHTAGVIGLGAALTYLTEKINFIELQEQETALCNLFLMQAQSIPNIQILGPNAFNKKHLISFSIKTIHSHDVAAYLDNYNICVRAGNHCAQPLHQALEITNSVRISLYIYNTDRELKKLIKLLSKLI